MSAVQAQPPRGTHRVTCRWKIAEIERERARGLATALDIPPLMAHLLLLRGIDTPESAADFLAPSLKHLSDPFLLTDMAPVVARITEARARGEHVRVFGDYDVDGIAATALLTNGLRRFGLEHVSHGMPHRLTEGYGINADHVEIAHREGVALIITVDNGICAHDAARRARELGVDLIVTDHHSINGGLPDALAVINPKREAPDFPGEHLCGAGIAFKLATALNGSPNDLDIAALGTVADVVPLTGENRTIVALGLRHMARHQRLGLRQLATAAGIRLDTVSSENIGFQLGPRINAAGRLDDALAALRLLLSQCPEETGTLAKLLNEANQERRAIEQRIFEEAVEEVDAMFIEAQRGIVVARRGWHQGVIGIVAARVQARFQRPAIVIALDEDGVGHGSARAGEHFDMVGALGACREHLEKFGGHRAAAGMTLREDCLAPFRAAFEAEALRQLGAGAIERELRVDCVASFSQIDHRLLTLLERLEPVGQMNPAPVFCTLGAEVLPSSVRVLKEHHLKLSVRHEDRVLSAIGFNMAERFPGGVLPRQVDLAYCPKLNTWRGDTSIQLVLKDLRPA